MTQSAKQVLESFQELTDAEKHELTLEVLRWWQGADHPPVSDQELTSAADSVFQLYDEEERSRA